MNLLTSISILLLTVISTSAQYCTAVCMTKFHKSIAEITGIGSSETTTMLAPFHKIIASTEDNRSAHKQIRSLCTRVKSWETCVRSCSRDSARAILLSSMDQWKKFCALMRKPTRASNEYLNCERDHQQQVSKHCDVYMPTTFTITVFCKSLEKYRDCSDRYMHQCSDEAFIVKKAIDDAIQNSFSKVLKFATNRIRLPQRCNMYHRSHHYNKQRGEINHKPIITSTISAVTSAAITTSPAISDVFAPEIEMSKIEKAENPCDCEVKHCPQKCLSTLVSGTTTALATTTTPTTTTISTSSASNNSSILPENSKESQLLVNSYPLIFQFSMIIFLITNLIVL
ncbi:hypothetical protein CRE_00260 [Caenorhabditis remanei]|uniref:Uncharacterized protein n=1 Tax=Caenorhabditis remanei TaxID=31234 RepID=E3LE56_CAERE|nr:hypothetical protein CRE_00260 [Caenorhabditis remanei]